MPRRSPGSCPIQDGPPRNVLTLDTTFTHTRAHTCEHTHTHTRTHTYTHTHARTYTLQSWDLVSLCNGVLVGLVSITAGAHVLEPWAALITGLVGGLIFDGMCAAFLKLRIDDPLSAAPMHGWCGMW